MDKSKREEIEEEEEEEECPRNMFFFLRTCPVEIQCNSSRIQYTNEKETKKG